MSQSPKDKDIPEGPPPTEPLSLITMESGRSAGFRTALRAVWSQLQFLDDRRRRAIADEAESAVAAIVAGHREVWAQNPFPVDYERGLLDAQRQIADFFAQDE